MAVVKSAAVLKKRVRPKLTSLQRSERRTRLLNMTRALAQEGATIQHGVRAFAQEHGRTEGWAKRQLLIHRTIRRAPNPWNAYTREKLQIHNKDRPRGERLTMPQFVSANRKTLREGYAKLTVDDKTALCRGIEVIREENMKTVRANPKAFERHVKKTFQEMSLHWSTICNQTQLNGFYVAVRDNPEDDIQPQLFYTKKFGDFIRDVTGMEPELFALRAEAYITTGLNDLKKPRKLGNRKENVAIIRKIVQDGLDHAVLSTRRATESVQMQYALYERRIVASYGVKLIGWPLDDFINPGDINQTLPVARILAALEAKTCRWIVLEQEEWNEEKARIQAEWLASRPKKASKNSKSPEMVQDIDGE